MAAIASSRSRSYVSRRKRRLLSAGNSLLGTRFLLVFLGLLVLGLLVSLGIIATYVISPDSVTTDPQQNDGLSANIIIGLFALAGATGSARP